MRQPLGYASWRLVLVERVVLSDSTGALRALLRYFVFFTVKEAAYVRSGQ